MTNRNLRTTPHWRTTSSSLLCCAEADAGAADAGAAAAGAGAGAAADAGAAQPAFYESFTKEALKTSPSIQRYKTVEELAEGYVNVEKRLGVPPERRIDLPADPNDKDGMRAVYARLGMPEKPGDYGFKLADDASEIDKGLVARGSEALHAAGLSTTQARAAFEWFIAEQGRFSQASAEAFQAQAAEGKAALQKEWGQAYDTRAKEIGQLLVKYGDADLVKELDGDKLGNYPNLARFIGKLIDRMAEPGVVGDRSGDAPPADRPMTPAQAKAAVTTLEVDPVKGKALLDKNHPMHKAVVEERNRLLAMTTPQAA